MQLVAELVDEAAQLVAELVDEAGDSDMRACAHRSRHTGRLCAQVGSTPVGSYSFDPLLACM